MKKSVFDWIARVLVIVGALNWGLAIWNINLVAMLSIGWMITTVYALVGLAGVWEIVKLVK